MKKTLLTAFIGITAIVSSTAFAAEKITVVSMSPKASAATPFGMAVKSATKGKYYQSANCEDALRKFNATDNSVLIYNSSMEFAGRNKGLDCRLDSLLDSKKVAFVGMRIEEGISLHGLAINVCNSLQTFSLIDPCGIPNLALSSLVKISRQNYDQKEIAHALLMIFKKELEKEIK